MNKRIMTAVVFVMMGTAMFAAKKKSKEEANPKAERAPQWVDSPTSVYPTAQYFRLVGTGADRASAELNAVRGIAAIFSQNVQNATHASKRMEQAVKDGKMATSIAAGISQETASQVNMDDVVDVEVKGYWQNVQEGNYQAIAVLDKQKTAAMYTSMIQTNDREVRSLMDVDENDTASYYTFETYARFDLAREIAAKNEGYIGRLQVVDPNVASSLRSSCVPSKQLKGKALEIAKAIPIGIIVEGEREGRVKASFANAVSAAGFRTSDLPGERYVITVKVSYERHDTKDGKTVQCRYNVDAPLRDSVMDEVLFPYSLSGRVFGNDWESAQYNVYKTIEKKVKEDFSKSFTEYVSTVAAY